MPSEIILSEEGSHLGTPAAGTLGLYCYGPSKQLYMVDDTGDHSPVGLINGSITHAMLTTNIVDDLTIGTGVPGFVKRQGGDPADWAVVGTTNYTNINPRMFSGAIRWTGSATIGDNQIVTMPTAFSNKFHFFAQCTSNTDIAVIPVVTSASAGLIIWVSFTATTHTQLDFVWWAVGPE